MAFMVSAPSCPKWTAPLINVSAFVFTRVTALTIHHDSNYLGYLRKAHALTNEKCKCYKAHVHKKEKPYIAYMYSIDLFGSCGELLAYTFALDVKNASSAGKRRE